MDKAALAHRHDIVVLDDIGRNFAAAVAYELNPGVLNAGIDELLRYAPAIVKRQESFDPEYLEVGFSSCYKTDGNRLRIVSKIPKRFVQKIVTPFEISAPDRVQNMLPLLGDIENAARQSKVKLGYFGSVALQMFTGLSYCTENSDLDIYLEKLNGADLLDFYNKLKLLEQRYSIHIDAELAWDSKFDVKLSEVFSGQKTILAKGLYEVILIDIT